MKTSLILCLSVALFGLVHSSPLKVVDGNDAKIPYQVHLYVQSTNFLDLQWQFNWNCTGVLISESYVLTNSYCQSREKYASRVTVTLGVENIANPESSQQTVSTRIAWSIVNADFVYHTLENNIGLVKLPSPVTLNDDIQLATLASTDNVNVGQIGTISGWGVNPKSSENKLQSASVKVVANSVCAHAYPYIYTGSNVICVQGVNGGSACNDDGGAPLVIDEQVVGIYSGGPAYVSESGIADYCSGKPNIFTKVASYLDWIKNNTDL